MLKENEKVLGLLIKKIIVYAFIKTMMVLFREEKKDSLLNGLEAIDRNFKYVENKINEDNLSKRLRYRFSKHETIDQLENVFVFDLETCNDQDFAEAYAAVIYDVKRSRDKWDRNITTEEIQTERKYIIVLKISIGHLRIFYEYAQFYFRKL